MWRMSSLKISRRIVSHKPQFHSLSSSQHHHHLQSNVNDSNPNPNPNLNLNLNFNVNLPTCHPSLLKPLILPTTPISSSAIILNLLQSHRFYSFKSQSNEPPEDEESESQSSEYPSKNPEFKHQEIDGPTVDKDESPLANETREVSLRLMKTMYHTSTALALLGLSHLSFTAASFYLFPAQGTTTTTTWALLLGGSSFISFGFPFSMAFMLRRSLKPMRFFHKMEDIGRLQILTSTMQISKQLHLFFLRLRTLAFLSLAGLPIAFSFSLLSSSSSS